MPPDAPLRLRGHHLLCLLTYKGLGYSPVFVAGMTAVATALTAGREAVIVDGPDDICAPLCLAEDKPHCHEETVPLRDARALALVAGVLGRPLAAGDRLRLDRDMIARLRAAYAAGAFTDACSLCEWQPLCRDIAAAGFGEVILFGTD